MWNAIEMQFCISCLTQLNLTAETLRFIDEIFKHGEAQMLFWVFSVSFRLYGALAENTNSSWQFERSSPLKPVPSELSSFPHCSTDLVKETE